jgi:hypothetical protein
VDGVAALATNFAHDALGTLPMVTITVDQVAIIIVVVGVLAPDPDLLTVLDTIDQAVGPDMMMMTEFEIEVHAAIVPVVESVPQAQSANHPHRSRPKMNETGGLSLCNNLLLG